MQVFLLRDPSRPQYEMTRDLQYLCFYCCAQKSIWSPSSKGSRTCCSIPDCIHSHFPYGEFPCRWQQCLSLSHSSPPPSNKDSQSCCPCTTPRTECKTMKRKVCCPDVYSCCFQGSLVLHSANSYLLPVVESVRVVWIILGLTLHHSCSVPLREVKVGMNAVDVQNQLGRV